MYYIIITGVYVVFGVFIILNNRRKFTELERKVFDDGMRYKNICEEHSRFESALILIRMDELLKREIIELAEKALIDNRPMTNKKPHDIN